MTDVERVVTSVTIELDDEMLACVKECAGEGEALGDVVLDLMWVGVLMHRRHQRGSSHHDRR